jgi:hypothetical protein
MEHLERAAVVVQFDPRDQSQQPVGNRRRKLAGKEVILPPPAPPADNRVRFRQTQQTGKVRGVVLQVPVCRGNQPAAGGSESGRKRGRLTEVSREPDDPDT